MRYSAAYTMKYQPIKLKQLLIDCDITQTEIARATGTSRASANLAINRGYMPIKMKNYRTLVEEFIKLSCQALEWLDEKELKLSDIWEPLGKDLRKAACAGRGSRMVKTKQIRPMVPGDPNQITIDWEVEMVSQEAMKHFKIFRNPFIDDVQKEKDIFMSDEHRYIEAAMLDAARNSGFLAVIGEVGSGKSIMRRRVVQRLRQDDNILIIFPQIIDKARLNAASICDAIIMDISDQKPRMKLEAKSRQVLQLLLDRSKGGYRACLIIEEAHDLNPQTLKYLKRFYELEDGYKKLIGIILVGQTELKNYFDEKMHVEMREVIRRVQIAEIKGLNGDIKAYLELKFKRIGIKLDNVFDTEAVKALSKRLTSKDRDNRVVSHAYPLLVNNYTAKAMNAAFEMGEKIVTAEIVMSI